MSRRNPFLALERRIAADERGGIIHRWQYGRELLKAKAGRRKLPDGFLDDRITEAEREGHTISRQEIQRRIRCAEVYGDDRQLRQAADAIGSWSALVNAGFPPVEPIGLEDLEAAGIPVGPPEFEQLTLIPGMPTELKIRGRKVTLAEATVADAKAYRDMYREMHESFGKTLAQVEMSVEAMVDGSGGDDAVNAVEAWRRATGE